MNNEEKTTVSIARDWANLLITILTPILVSIGIYLFNTKMDNLHLTVTNEMNDRYVAKQTFDAANADTNHRIDELSQKMDTVGREVSEINGRLRNRPPLNPVNVPP
jgi:hypothetical protein